MRLSLAKTRQTKNRVTIHNPPQDERRTMNDGPSDSGMDEAVEITPAWKDLTESIPV
jgi:hypothetical protein